MTLPRAIFFDLDDTLISSYNRPNRAWTRVLAEFAEDLAEVGIEAVLEALRETNRVFWADPEDHRVWRLKILEARREVVVRALRSLGLEMEELAHRIGDAYSDLRKREMHLYPGVHETLDALRQVGVRLALITNGASDQQRPKIDRFDLADRFDHIQIEGEFGIGKPDPRAYENLLKVLEVSAEDAWMVGDNLEWEVAAPQRLGIHAIWCDPLDRGLPEDTKIAPDRIIRSVTELKPGDGPGSHG